MQAIGHVEYQQEEHIGYGKAQQHEHPVFPVVEAVAGGDEQIPPELLLVKYFAVDKKDIKNQNRQTGRCEIEAVQDHAERADSHQHAAPLLPPPVGTDQHHQQKRHVFDEHDLRYGLPDDGEGQHQHQRPDEALLLTGMAAKPEKAQNAICQLRKHPDDLEPGFHGDKRKKPGEQIERVVKSVIGEIPDVLPASEFTRELREKVMRPVKTFSEIIGIRRMLIDPVFIRSCDRTALGMNASL